VLKYFAGAVRRAGWLALVLAAPLLGMPARAAELSATELRWIRGAQPVLAFARAQGLPLDIVVQPQPTPGAAPLALGFVDGRCKLVLSMRGNPEAEATLARISPPLLAATLELMAAHELGHCRRYLDGAWFALPAGFSAAEPDALNPAPRAARKPLATWWAWPGCSSSTRSTTPRCMPGWWPNAAAT